MNDRDRLAVDLAATGALFFETQAARLLALGWTQSECDEYHWAALDAQVAEAINLVKRGTAIVKAYREDANLCPAAARTTKHERIASLLVVLPEQRERMQRYETGRNEERDDNYAIAATDRTVLIEQIDRIAKAYREDTDA